jgi:ATPase family associated with various cellular activities (AAA)
MDTFDVNLEADCDLEVVADVGHDRLPLRLALGSDAANIVDALLTLRALQALNHGATCYPVYRLVRSATRRQVDELFDDLALRCGLAAHRLGESALLLDGAGALVSARGRRKTDYSSLTFAIWAISEASLISVRDRLLAVVGDQRICEETFTIDWHFMSSHAGLTSATFEELADPAPLDQAYPTLNEPVDRFIGRYLDARETVLILQGPPGTGKTRFVRAVLAAMSRRKGNGAKVLYTTDTRSLESDEIFVEFVTGSHDAFVIEDADHMLDARANGNLHLHRFLAVADGVVRAQGRKILFTTNLPNVSDIDDALLRPGRCFANVRLRALERPEAERLLACLCGSDAAQFSRVLAAALPAEARAVTLASIYSALDAANAQAAPRLAGLAEVGAKRAAPGTAEALV